MTSRESTPPNTKQHGVDNHYQTKHSDLPEPDDTASTETPTSAQPPMEDHIPLIRPPGVVAAGLPAVLATLKHTVGEMGVGRSISTLRKVNQIDGFDCQSCAWPNPDDHRHLAEFCENGAKAVAEEATTRRITSDFFQIHSIDELALQSDHWLGKQGRLT